MRFIATVISPVCLSDPHMTWHACVQSYVPVGKVLFHIRHMITSYYTEVTFYSWLQEEIGPELNQKNSI